MANSVFPSSYYKDPADSVGLCRHMERKAEQKASRKAYRAMHGCLGCQRYNHQLKGCGEAQAPHAGGFCTHWWSDKSPIKAPEVV